MPLKTTCCRPLSTFLPGKESANICGGCIPRLGTRLKHAVRLQGMRCMPDLSIVGCKEVEGPAQLKSAIGIVESREALWGNL